MDNREIYDEIMNDLQNEIDNMNEKIKKDTKEVEKLYKLEEFYSSKKRCR